MSQDPSEDNIPDFPDDFGVEEQESGGFLNKLKGMFKKSGSDDAFGQTVSSPDDAFGQAPLDSVDPIALQEQEDAMFAKRRKVMGFVFIGAFLGLIGLGVGASMIDWSLPDLPQSAQSDDHDDDKSGEKKSLTDAIAQIQKQAPQQGHAASKPEGSHTIRNNMPVASGPEDLQKALISPPSAHLQQTPDMDRRKRSLTALTPEQLAAQQAAKAAAPQTEQPQTAPPAAEPAHTPAPVQPEAPVAPAKSPAPSPSPKTVAQTPDRNFVIPVLPAPRSDFKKKAEAPQLASLAKRPEGLKLPTMQKAPQPDLQHRTASGKTVPTISPDGRRAWKVYAQPYERAKGNPQISVIIQNLGQVKMLTTAAVLRTPPEVALSFSSYAPQLNRQLAEARKHGHETLMNIGLESSSFPDDDPGPDGLFTALSVGENTKRLEQSLAKASVYLGVVASGGDRLVNSESHFTVLMENIKRMGLLYVASSRKVAPFDTAQQKPARVIADVHIRQETFRDQVKAYLRAAEDVARETGHAVVLVDATPLSLELLSAWFQELPKRAFQLAPITSQAKE